MALKRVKVATPPPIKCCKHGLPPDQCAPCAGPVRVPKPIWTEAMMPRKKREVKATVDAAWSLPTTTGPITICGGCFGLANDHRDSIRDIERHIRLVAYIRTSKCKFCGDAYVEDEACPKRLHMPDTYDDKDRWQRGHQRKWLVRAAKVPACKACSATAEWEVDAEDLVTLPNGRTNRQNTALELWTQALLIRGLLA